MPDENTSSQENEWKDGKCVQVCPLNNVQLKNGKPAWGSNCTHCMACICYCPAEAIEYDKKSEEKPRYTFEKNFD